MDLTKYQETVKELNAKKPTENYMVFILSYDTKILLPHKAALTFISALENAELLKDSYSDKCQITPLDRDAISSSFLSGEEYQQIKIANLLNVGLDDIKKLKQSA